MELIFVLAANIDWLLVNLSLSLRLRSMMGDYKTENRHTAYIGQTHARNSSLTGEHETEKRQHGLHTPKPREK